MTIDAYCLKCKTTRTITNAEEHVNARGSRMAQGLCPVCGTKVTKFLPKADAAAKQATASTSATKEKAAASAPTATATGAKRGAKKTEP